MREIDTGATGVSEDTRIIALQRGPADPELQGMSTVWKFASDPRETVRQFSGDERTLRRWQRTLHTQAEILHLPEPVISGPSLFLPGWGTSFVDRLYAEGWHGWDEVLTNAQAALVAMYPRIVPHSITLEMISVLPHGRVAFPSIVSSVPKHRIAELYPDTESYYWSIHDEFQHRWGTMLYQSREDINGMETWREETWDDYVPPVVRPVIPDGLFKP